MLILDSFHRYTVNSVKNKLVEKNTNIVIISGGCIFKLQLLDNAINKSFKSKVKLLLYYIMKKNFFLLIFFYVY